MTDSLFDRLEATGRMPTPPGVVLKLLELTRREDVSARDIADTLAQDPPLAAKVLRFANSPMAGVPREVTSLQRAVALVGARGIKMMALSFAVLGNAKTESCAGFDQTQFNMQSIGCGVAAKMLASTGRIAGAQEAFLAGLLSQIGRAALACGVPEEYACVLAEAQQVPRDLCEIEVTVLGQPYPVIGAQLLRSWQIPDTLCAAIETFHCANNGSDVSPLAKVLYVAQIVAGIICPDAKGDPPDTSEFVGAAKKLLGIEEDRCAELMNEIANEIENTRTTLDMPQGKIRSPEDIQSEVRERIAELSLAMHLENQVMQQQQADLMRRATTDALTGIGNRAAFDARMELELERSARSGAPFALLMMDVDKFKNFNDTYGHQAGDRVLQAVAKVLDDNVRKVDYVARYGGEEFAVVAPDTTTQGVANLGERLRAAVEATSLSWEGQALGVTISIGAAVFSEVIDKNEAANIIKVADGQLYVAKQAGRNRVCMVVDGGEPVEAALIG